MRSWLRGDVKKGRSKSIAEPPMERAALHSIYRDDSRSTVSKEELERFIREVKDYQITHGSLLKIVQEEQDASVPSRPVGVSLVPSQFPRECFTKAMELQTIFNELYMRVTADEQWLEATLKDLIRHDPLTSTLWGIHVASRDKLAWPRQTVSLGIFRSDYMVHVDNLLDKAVDKPWSKPELRQVEFNTYTVAGGVHADIISDMHAHLHRTGLYRSVLGPSSSATVAGASAAGLPPNRAKDGIVEAIALAHERHYERLSSKRNVAAAVLFVVQPRNFNVCDERPLEYALWQRQPPIPAYRVVFGGELLERTTLGPRGELLFYPYRSVSAGSVFEVSVAYMRAGHELVEYDEAGRAARLRLEQSRAIKCPSLMCHLATFKKIQQQLSVPGQLSHFLAPDKAQMVAATFAAMYPLDESELGMRGRGLVDVEAIREHVLKPSLEGGGNNVFGVDIPAFLAHVRQEHWHRYTLMELIRSPTQYGMLISPRGLYKGPTLSELGVLGTCLWQASGRLEVFSNENAGWTFKSKPHVVQEMSVVKGYGCFDSPWLVDIP